jgi:hypothetical protein
LVKNQKAALTSKGKMRKLFPSTIKWGEKLPLSLLPHVVARNACLVCRIVEMKKSRVDKIG